MKNHLYVSLFTVLLAGCVLRPAELKTLKDVEGRLDSRQAEIGPYTLDMKAEGSKMILNGTVGSESGRDEIERVVASSPGVATVQNNLVVDRSLRRTESSGLTTRVREDIMAQFRTIRGNKPIKATVTVDGGVVTLSGMVSSDAERKEFVRSASNIPGVTTVVDELRVPPPLTDEQLIERVKMALSTEGLTSAGPVNVDSSNGTVMVSGDRRSFREVDKVLSVVLMVDGVDDVKSSMTVNGMSYNRSIQVH